MVHSEYVSSGSDMDSDLETNEIAQKLFGGKRKKKSTGKRMKLEQI